MTFFGNQEQVLTESNLYARLSPTDGPPRTYYNLKVTQACDLDHLLHKRRQPFFRLHGYRLIATVPTEASVEVIKGAARPP